MGFIIQSKFLISSIKKEQWIYDKIPEFCFVGRSNVGKSTFLNTICNNNKLAKISKKPGKTQTINFFSINNNIFRFVDLPGYGFAKISNEKKIQFSKMINEYFYFRKNLKVVFFLLDLRRIPNEDDINMLKYLQYNHLKFYLVASKIDKVKNSMLIKNKETILTILKFNPNTPIILFSSINKKGINVVIEKIKKNINI